VSTVTIYKFLCTTKCLSTLCSVFFVCFPTLNFMLYNVLPKLHYFAIFVNTDSVYTIFSFTFNHYSSYMYLSVHFKTKCNSFFSLTRGQRLLPLPLVKTLISKFPPKSHYPATGYILLTGYVHFTTMYHL